MLSSMIDKFQCLYESVKHIIESLYPTNKMGRPRISNKKILTTILYKIKTGTPWGLILECDILAKGKTAHNIFQKWVRLGIFDKIRYVCAELYEILIGYQYTWQSLDATKCQAPVRGTLINTEKRGRNPTDRGFQGSKISLIVDAEGIPLGEVTDAANVHDSKLLHGTIMNSFINGRYKNSNTKVMNLCLDKAFDGDISETIIFMYGFQAHIRSRGEEKEDKATTGKKARRYVVERSMAWLKGFHECRTRYTRKALNFDAIVKLACSAMIYMRLLSHREQSDIDKIANFKNIQSWISQSEIDKNNALSLSKYFTGIVF